MMLIKTYIGPSPIHGTGLYAAEPVAKGTVIWRFAPGFDQRYTREQIASLPPQAALFIAIYGYRSRVSGLYVLDNDLSRHMNHSETAPCCEERIEPGEEETLTVATKDIAADEEIIVDYSTFEKFDDPDNILFDIVRKHGSPDPRLK